MSNHKELNQMNDLDQFSVIEMFRSEIRGAIFSTFY